MTSDPYLPPPPLLRRPPLLLRPLLRYHLGQQQRPGCDMGPPSREQPTILHPIGTTTDHSYQLFDSTIVLTERRGQRGSHHNMGPAEGRILHILIPRVRGSNQITGLTITTRMDKAIVSLA
jgi:hypothetical protein